MTAQTHRISDRKVTHEPLVSVIIVTYHNETTIAACLTSLVAYSAIPWEAVVVDNSSDLATWECIQAVQRSHPDISLTSLRPGHNLGFAAGCNLGAQHARGDFLLFLNPDTRLENDILAVFLSYWEKNKHVGLLGPCVLDARGQIERTCRNLPSILRIFLDATGLDRLAGQYRLLHFDHQAIRQVPQIIGACLFTSRQRYQSCNGMDERFFIYFEEVDLCRRMFQSGYSVWFLPTARIMHVAGVSCESESSAAHMIVQLRKSRQLYFRKHCTQATVFVIAAISILEGWTKAFIFFARYLVRKKKRDLEKAKGFWRVATCLASWL
ncbi:hypothetical protein MASR1M90_07260 [Desulfovibrionales bacterium]